MQCALSTKKTNWIRPDIGQYWLRKTKLKTKNGRNICFSPLVEGFVATAHFFFLVSAAVVVASPFPCNFPDWHDVNYVFTYSLFSFVFRFAFAYQTFSCVDEWLWFWWIRCSLRKSFSVSFRTTKQICVPKTFLFIFSFPSISAICSWKKIGFE